MKKYLKFTPIPLVIVLIVSLLFVFLPQGVVVASEGSLEIILTQNIPDYLTNPTYKAPELVISDDKTAVWDLSGNLVKLGDINSVELRPRVTYERWAGESWVSIELISPLPTTLTKATSLEPDKIEWDGSNLSINYYPLTKEQSGAEFGAFETELMLHQKPASNIITFRIKATPDVVFVYQPQLTEIFNVGDKWHGVVIDSVTETEIRDKDGKVLLFTPEKVGGGYSVKSSIHKNHIAGQVNYGTGKLGDIYRPQVIDSKGWQVWGELNIADGFMTVTLPQDFIDKAVYPIYKAAGLEWGFTDIGGSSDFPPGNMLFGSTSTSPDTANMTGDSMEVYCFGDGAEVKQAIYENQDDGDYIADGLTPAANMPEFFGWTEAVFASSPDIGQDTTYLLTFIHDGAVSTGFKIEAGAQNRQDWTNSFAAPGSFDWDGGVLFEYSIFVNYSAAPPEAAITNAPDFYNFGVVATSTTYSTGLDHFTVTNTTGGGAAVDIDIHGHDWVGGVGWTLSDTATAGVNTVGLKAGLDGGAYNIIVKKNVVYNDLKLNLADTATQDWGLQLVTATSHTDGVLKESTVTITATLT